MRVDKFLPILGIIYQEKINEHYIENNHGVPTSEINILELNQSVIYGSEEEYADLISYIQSNS